MEFYSVTKKLCLSFNSIILKHMEADPELLLIDEYVVIHSIKYKYITGKGVIKAVLKTKGGSRSSGRMQRVGVEYLL